MIVIHHNPDCGTSRNVLALRLCRPSEAVLDLIDRLPPGPFAKEDGSLIIDAKGKRIV